MIYTLRMTGVMRQTAAILCFGR